MAELTNYASVAKDWHLGNPTAERYRRSMVPFYLLENESNRYPIYVDNSNLNPNLTQNYKIKYLTVHVTRSVLSELNEQVKKTSPRQSKRFTQVLMEPGGGKMRHSTHDSATFQIKLRDVSLLSTAQKLIKMVEWKIEERSKFIFEQMNRLQVLKFKGADSFVYGETQLIYFVEIREHLRSKNENLELFLVSLNLNNLSGSSIRQHATSSRPSEGTQFHFPPIVDLAKHSRDEQQKRQKRKSVLHSLEMQNAVSTHTQSEASSQRALKKQIDALYKNVTIFNWYMPLANQSYIPACPCRLPRQRSTPTHENQFQDIRDKVPRRDEACCQIQPSH